MKVAGKHACNDVWEVKVGMDPAVLCFTIFNATHLSQYLHLGAGSNGPES